MKFGLLVFASPQGFYSGSTQSPRSSARPRRAPPSGAIPLTRARLDCHWPLSVVADRTFQLDLMDLLTGLLTRHSGSGETGPVRSRDSSIGPHPTLILVAGFSHPTRASILILRDRELGGLLKPGSRGCPNEIFAAPAKDYRASLGNYPIVSIAQRAQTGESSWASACRSNNCRLAGA